MPIVEFDLIVDALQTTNELDIKVFRKFRDNILKESTAFKEKEIYLQEFLEHARNSLKQEQDKIIYNKSEILCKYANQ